MLTPDDQLQIAVRMLGTEEGSWSMTGKHLRQLQGAYVYHLTRETEEEPDLYIGVKSSKWERPFDPNHHAVGLWCDVRDDDVMHIYPMPTPAIAKWFEKVVLAYMPTQRNKHRHYDTRYQFGAINPVPGGEWSNEHEGLNLAL